MRDRRNLPNIDETLRRTWRRRREDYSAGGVAYRWSASQELEVALIATQNGMRWQLPKGTCEEDESAQETAVREVEEEVGLKTVCERFLESIEYWYWDTYRKHTPELVHKRVDFYLLRVVGGELSDKSVEVDSVAWFTFEQALDLLTYASERAVVVKAACYLRGDEQESNQR
ncbi:MAG: NUDIX hydrolase [Caldilineaceae bacterium]|nr:NUDIX hydrolase [Caldilineaceae bacterium]